LDNLEGHYCYRNCIGCSAFSLATAGLLVIHLTWRTWDGTSHVRGTWERLHWRTILLTSTLFSHEKQSLP